MQYDGGTILALDPAIRTGIAEGVPGAVPSLAHIDFRRDPVEDSADIFARALRWAGHRFADDPPSLLVLEDLVLVYDKTIQSGLQAIFLAVARCKGVPVQIVKVATWRLHVLGSGKLKGPVAKQRAVEVCHMLGWVPEGQKLTHDAAEAGCQWLHACSLVAPRQAQRAPLFLREAR